MSSFFSPARKGEMEYLPLMLRRVLTAKRLWDDLGISWSELAQMDAREVREIINVLHLQDDSLG